MTTEDDFQAKLDADVTDWQTRLVLADFLQERDDPRAAGYRALGELQIWPHVWNGTTSGLLGKKLCGYHNGKGRIPKAVRPSWHSVLPPAWFRACFIVRHDAQVQTWVLPPDLRDFDYARRYLEDVAIKAFMSLTSEIRDGLVRSGLSRLRTTGLLK